MWARHRQGQEGSYLGSLKLAELAYGRRPTADGVTINCESEHQDRSYVAWGVAWLNRGGLAAPLLL